MLLDQHLVSLERQRTSLPTGRFLSPQSSMSRSDNNKLRQNYYRPTGLPSYVHIFRKFINLSRCLYPVHHPRQLPRKVRLEALQSRAQANRQSIPRRAFDIQPEGFQRINEVPPDFALTRILPIRLIVRETPHSRVLNGTQARARTGVHVLVGSYGKVTV